MQQEILFPSDTAIASYWNYILLVLIFFRCSNAFIMQKVYFSQLMRAYVGLIMFAACT
jgi:hypothetical protein